jgi:Raf kinase inhibitor-like YbhB/YbcL family protein
VLYQTHKLLFRAGLVGALAAVMGLAGCQASQPESGKSEGAKPMTIKVTTTAFAEGQPIPKKHTGEGQDVSPALAWTGIPQGTKELALICDDPDAPKGTWVHWVIYKIPADSAGLPEGIPRDARLKTPAGALQGTNSWPKGENMGYLGPMPPPGHGTHHYYFHLYALDAPLAVEPGLDKQQLLKKMEGHILGEGEVMGTYRRELSK